MRQQLAYRFALIANARPKLDMGAVGTVVDRIIDDVAVSIAAIDRHPVAAARAQAFAHPRERGATIGAAATAGTNASGRRGRTASPYASSIFTIPFLPPKWDIPPIRFRLCSPSRSKCGAAVAS